MRVDTVDTARRDSVHFVPEDPVRFPDVSDRMYLLGIMVVGMGGLALLLNGKRVMADRRQKPMEGNAK